MPHVEVVGQAHAKVVDNVTGFRIFGEDDVASSRASRASRNELHATGGDVQAMVKLDTPEHMLWEAPAELAQL